MNDYAGHYETLKMQVRHLYHALLRKEFEEACNIVSDIHDEATQVRLWCRQQLDQDVATK